MHARAFLITGIPGAGKSTVSRLLAERFPLAAHIESDLLQQMIVSGGVWPDGEPSDEAHRQLALRGRNTARLADAFASGGVLPIVDDVIVGRSRLDLYLETLEARPLCLVVLAPPLEVTLERDRTRGYKRVGDTWAHLHEIQERELGGLGLWLDTADLTLEETVAAILTREQDGLL